jgi:hypothetical protein
MDISTKMRTARPSVLVLLSTSENLFRPFLRELSHSAAGIIIITGKGSVPVKLATLDGQGWTPSEISLQHVVSCSSQIYTALLTALRTRAGLGFVQTPISVLTSMEGVSEDLVLKAEEMGLVNVHFCPWDRSGERLIGLKVTHPSVELLKWVFKSIREDRLTPSEMYIRELLAMAFGYRPDASEWKWLLRLSQFPLLITSGIDSLTSLPASIILPKGESWEVADSTEKTIAVSDCIKTLINKAKELTTGKEMYSWLRYIQLCTPNAPSLGNLVKWVRTVALEASSRLPNLEETQLAVMDLLSASPEGLPLACLPHLLTYKFCRPIQASHFGLSKLSDLLEGIPDVRIEGSGEEGTVKLTGHSSLTSTADGETTCFYRSLTANAATEELKADNEELDLLNYYEPHLKEPRHIYSRSADMRSSSRWARLTIPSFGSVLDMETPSISSKRLDTLSEEDSSSPQLEQPASPSRALFEGLSS